jgi:hypothetical protein
MRFGIVLQPPLARDAALAEELGFDLVWVDQVASAAPLVTMGGLAACTHSVRLAAGVAAGAHPITVAEDAAVADLASGGRLILVLDGAEQDLMRETVELVFRSWAPRSFRHCGPRWTAPAHMPEHEHAEARVRVTPAPAQFEPTVWLRGAAAGPVARELGLAPVFDDTDSARSYWAARESAPADAAAVLRLRRPGRVRVDVAGEGTLDVSSLVRVLRERQDAWGLDVAVLELPATLGLPPRERALRRIATAVRPRLQIDRLPAGLTDHWRAREKSRGRRP